MHSRTKVWFGSFALKWISWLSPNLGENRCATLNSCPQNGAMCALDLYVFVPLTSMAKSEQTDFTHFCVLKVCISSLSLSVLCVSLPPFLAPSLAHSLAPSQFSNDVEFHLPCTNCIGSFRRNFSKWALPCCSMPRSLLLRILLSLGL